MRSTTEYGEEVSKNLRNTFLELAAKKPLADITVQEVARRTKMTRSTFYNYYASIDDLVSQIRDEGIALLMNFIGQALEEDQSEQLELENLPSLAAIYKIADGDFAFLLNDPIFVQNLKGLLKEYLGCTEPQAPHEPTSQELAIEAILCAQIGLAAYWFSRPHRQPVEALCDLGRSLLPKMRLERQVKAGTPPQKGSQPANSRR